MAELGYREGRTHTLDVLFANGKLDRLPQLARELVDRKVSVIVTAGDAATRAAQRTTTIIPIVIANTGDPIGGGFVKSLANPGGKITGLSLPSPELSGKSLEILREGSMATRAAA